MVKVNVLVKSMMGQSGSEGDGDDEGDGWDWVPVSGAFFWSLNYLLKPRHALPSVLPFFIGGLRIAPLDRQGAVVFFRETS